MAENISSDFELIQIDDVMEFENNYSNNQIDEVKNKKDFIENNSFENKINNLQINDVMELENNSKNIQINEVVKDNKEDLVENNSLENKKENVNSYDSTLAEYYLYGELVRGRLP
uniref:Uncharacterized protein n=1 Tax=Meloidogyne floridensis TaxID=298350 RepID=A0A915PAL2_9BILA